MMARVQVGGLAALAVVLGSGLSVGAEEVVRDVVIYGSTPAAISAAVQAKRMGKSVVVVSPETRLGGLTTGGLGQTDFTTKEAFGGIAREFYAAIADYYRDERHWTRQKSSDYAPNGQCADSRSRETMWTFEPHAALEVIEGWVKRDGLDVRRGEYLDRRPKAGVEAEEGRIRSIRTLSGNVYRGRMFVDATYEGDLMAAAGIEYAVGREANGVYGETANGNQPRARGANHHQFVEGVDAHVVKGDPKSGLLPGVEPFDPNARTGDGDRRLQAYCFRMCLTDVPENRIPFAKPANYDERAYELLFRNFERAVELGLPMDEPWGESGRPWINSPMPNRKTDTNNRTAVSTDFIGGNWNWPEASYEERERILMAHLDWQKGLMWTLANHPRVPEAVRREVSRWGTCRDEFTDGLGDGWQRQLYVREARRMVGEYVMTEANCRGAAVARRPVALAAYGMDSHHVRRVATAEGFVRNEGNVEDYVAAHPGDWCRPYPIDYGALVPKRGAWKSGAAANLFVPVCVSATHIAFGSIRMEPTFFALGQAAGTAAALAIDLGCSVQDLPYGPLAARLLADGQRIDAEAPRSLVIAATNSPFAQKREADMLCAGRHDERVLNAAIARLKHGGTIRLADGDYSIDGFEQEGNSAVCFGYNDGSARTITFTGTTENKSYNTRHGVTIHVTKAAMDRMDTNGVYRVFFGTARRPKAPGDFYTMTHVNNVNFSNFYLYFNDASKPLRGIDGSNFGQLYVDLVGIYTENYFRDRFLHLKPATPVRGTVGVWSSPSSSDEMARVGYDWVNVGGLHVGFYFDRADHFVLRSCSAARCCYGYVFKGGPKTLTMLNCCDEGNTHLPRFLGRGHLTAIDFNIERFNAAYIPDDPEGAGEPRATEEIPGGWGGFVSYTLQGRAFGIDRFWAEGCGTRFETRDLNQ